MKLPDIENMENLVQTKRGRRHAHFMIRDDQNGVYISAAANITLNAPRVSVSYRKQDGLFMMTPEHSENLGLKISNNKWIYSADLCTKLIEIGYGTKDIYLAVIQGRRLIFSPDRNYPKKKAGRPRQSLRSRIRRDIQEVQRRARAAGNALYPRAPANFEELLRGHIYSQEGKDGANARPPIIANPRRKSSLADLRKRSLEERSRDARKEEGDSPEAAGGGG